MKSIGGTNESEAVQAGMFCPEHIVLTDSTVASNDESNESKKTDTLSKDVQ